MNSPEFVDVPLLGKLVPGGVRPGRVLLVEYDPESQWLAVATTITARLLESGGRIDYAAMCRPPEEVKRNLEALGIDVASAIKEKRLVVDDWHSATLSEGRIASGGEGGLFDRIDGGARVRSLKVADLSVEWLKASKHGWPAEDVSETWPPGSMAIGESETELLRFNEETPFIEMLTTRGYPSSRKGGAIHLSAFVRGVHSETLYKRMEHASDGVVDLRVIERGDQVKNLLRIRSLKGQPHDSRWHEIEVKPKGEAVLAT